MRERILTVAILAAASYPLQTISLYGQCQTIAGNTWSEDDGISGVRTYILSQDLSGNISGYSHHDVCISQDWPVSGHFASDGSFQIYVTNPSPGDPACSADWFMVDGTVQEPTCDSMSGSWTNGLGYFGDDLQWTKNCDVPTGEITFGDGWADALSYPTVYQYRQQLTGSVDFGGRTVHETFALGYDGSPYGPYPWAPDWGYWYVGSVDGGVSFPNTWGHDSVGWTPDAVTWYRQNPPPLLPCGVSWHQKMTIGCSSGESFYQANELSASFDSSVVNSQRSDQSASRVWP